LLYHPDRITEVKENFGSVFAQRIELKLPEKGRFADSTKVIAKLEGNGDGFPLEHLSDGMMRAVRILLQLASCREGAILVIDEPELHLHPGAARSLRNLMRDKKDKLQIICSTHSPIFLDPSCSDMIILHRTNEKPEILKAADVDQALLALGSSGLDAILYDVVIWLEGPSDKEYLQKWLELFAKDLKMPVNSIGLQQFGGGILEHVNPIVMKSIAR